MTCAAQYNLCIGQGETFVTTFNIYNTITVTETAAVGAVTLNVLPLPHSINNASTLTFGTVTVTLSSDASAGAETISVGAISTQILANTTARGNLLVLTGKQARAKIRKTYDAATALADFVCTPTDPGKVVISLTSTATAALAANITPSNAKTIANKQAITKDERKLFFPGSNTYYWDLEIYDGSDPPQVTRYIFGEVLVTAEATK